MNLTIVGTGYVGLVTGVCFAEFGYSVTCIDKDTERIEKLKSGKCPFFEPGMDKLLDKHINKTKLFTLIYLFEKVILKIKISRFKIKVMRFAKKIGVDEILYP